MIPMIPQEEINFAARGKSLNDCARMPRQQPIPASEARICKRVREWREKLGFSQVRFAQILGIDSTYLASIEHARNPLRYSLAYLLITRVSASPRWLATGQGSMMDVSVVPNPAVIQNGDRELFSDVYETEIKGLLPNTPADLEHKARRVLVAQIDEWLKRVPALETDRFVNQIVQHGENLLKQFCAPENAPHLDSRRELLARVEAMTRGQNKTRRT